MKCNVPVITSFGSSMEEIKETQPYMPMQNFEDIAGR
jgi:hypothetical protein